MTRYTDSDLALRLIEEGRCDDTHALLTRKEYEEACRAGVYDGCKPTGPSEGRLWVRHWGYVEDGTGPLASKQGGTFTNAELNWVDPEFVHCRQILFDRGES